MSSTSSRFGLTAFRNLYLIGPALLLATGCGPMDYQKPIQQFSDASSIVAASATLFLNNENAIEQEALVERLAFEAKPIDVTAIEQSVVISANEIKIRTKSILVLSSFTANLATLASGKAGTAVTQNAADLSSSMKKLATDAGGLPNSKLDNAHFAGLASAAAEAMGAVAKAIIDKKSRRDIEKTIQDNEKPIESLIELLGSELTLAYERQKSAVGAQSIYLSQAYSAELNTAVPNVERRISIAGQINAYRRLQGDLQAADPAPAVAKMRASFVALVAYSRSNRDPQSLTALWKAVQDFSAAAQPLAQAIQSLITAS
ncbi:hypothetical protein [Granulicella tundricola]|uniref:Lipoprotein n=1 Tax=Granulicella tundricola (strain ATCC BAA-1859 / DSM 23138 / MP5ACTX9) TaxID=1198114 RepID=E8X4Z1_GRATM|nr:hypothetical protein [Granulicella tundricola]ADW67183.1 hypothetical protein AciX9_0094 [Granulicella tundricola MP5ACTX9]